MDDFFIEIVLDNVFIKKYNIFNIKYRTFAEKNYMIYDIYVNFNNNEVCWEIYDIDYKYLNDFKLGDKVKELIINYYVSKRGDKIRKILSKL